MQTSVQEITTASDDLAYRTEQQAATLEESTAAIRDLADVVNIAAGNLIKTKDAISDVKTDTVASAEIVEKTIASISRIRASSQQIGTIIGVIDEIAFQTNLLALNAGVEAARAGDAGRGFAVVASEVRSLAKRSAEAAKEIKNLISTSATEISKGVELVGETGKAFDRIKGQISIVDGGIGEIAANAVEQSSALKQVSAAIGEIDSTTQRNAAMAEQAKSACQSLTRQTSDLACAVGQFMIDRPAIATERAAVSRAAASETASAERSNSERRSAA
jgi:methyl-accepting chemotaxis protein